ncbi:MAG TPA: hypothetical protein VK992_04595 [Candidatus Caenarcaniphilales bacterium]|nr:hypothetical protein [Candidatus Caenarcaniphilales bacterium]
MRGATVTNDRKRQSGRLNRRIRDDESLRVLSVTADESRGSSNLATRPRAGNISTDTRAGIPR